MRKLYSILLLLFTFNNIFTQHNCGTDHLHNQLMQNPAFSNAFNAGQAKLKNIDNSNASFTNGVYTLPVVVHVIHTGQALGAYGNPTDSYIQGLISDLNLQFFAGYPTYPDTNSGGTKIPIQFKLAKRTPNCTGTNGIVRYNASANSNYANNGIAWGGSSVGISQTDLANMSFWSSEHYINIWIVNNIQGFPAGYAYFPTGFPNFGEGIVLEALYATPPILSHEMGHYFNLMHTFQGSTGSSCPANTNCNSDGDNICDTDPHIEASGYSTSATNSCTGNTYGNIVLNYMSYSYQRMFTQGQKSRMLSALSTLRPYIINSLGADTPSTYTTTFSITPDTNNVCEGKIIKFTANYSNTGYFKPVIKWMLKNWNGTFNLGVTDTLYYTTQPEYFNQRIFAIIDTITVPCAVSPKPNSDTISIHTVYYKHLDNFRISANKNDYCYDSLVNISLDYNSQLVSTPLKSFTWYKNGAKLPQTDTFISFSAKTNDSVFCVIKSGYQCLYEDSGITNMIKPIVNPNLTAWASISLQKDTFCKGERPVILDTSQNCGGESLYRFLDGTWKALLNGLSMDSLGIGFDSIKNGDKFMYKITTGGCINPKLFTTNELTIRVKNPTPSSISISTDKDTACSGSKVLLSSNASHANPNALYRWYDANNMLLSDSARFNYTTTSDAIVRCEYIPQLACVLSSQSNTISLVVKPTRTITPLFSFTKNPLCENEPLLYNCILNDTLKLYKSELYRNNALLNTISYPFNGTIPNFANSDAFYTLHYYNDACIQSPVKSNTGLASVYLKQTPPVIVQNGNTLSSNYVDGSNLWFKDNISLGLSTQNISIQGLGIYHCQATNQYCTSDISNKITISNASLISTQRTELTIIPTNTDKIYQVIGLQKSTFIDIYNITGQRLKTINTDSLLNLSDLPQGIYFIQINNLFYKLSIN